MADWDTERTYRNDAGSSGRGSSQGANRRGDSRGGRSYRGGRTGGRSTDGRQSDSRSPRDPQNLHNVQTFDDGYRGGYRGSKKRSGRNRSRAEWGASRTQANERPAREVEPQLPTNMTCAATLNAHEKAVNALAFDFVNSQLYTGSADGFVKSWNCTTGEVVSSVEMGGSVDSLLVGGGYLFVGQHKGQEGVVKVWNMATGSSHILTGHKGAVTTLVASGANLFSSGLDASIRVWNFNQAAGIFTPQVIISKEEGGHSGGVQALVAHGPLMFSGDQAGCIKAWDLESGKCVQTLLGAHMQAIVQLLIFEGFLLSASLDGSVKCWQLVDPPGPNAVLRKEPEFVFIKDEDDGSGDVQQQPRQRQKGSGGDRRPTRRGVLQMYGALDPAQQPLLLVAYSGERSVRVYDLPNFATRGVMPQVSNARAIIDIPGAAVIVGDTAGNVKVFTWVAAAQQAMLAA